MPPACLLLFSWDFWDVCCAMGEASCYLRSLISLRQSSRGSHMQLNGPFEPSLLNYTGKWGHVEFIVPSIGQMNTSKRSQVVLAGAEESSGRALLNKFSKVLYSVWRRLSVESFETLLCVELWNSKCTKELENVAK
jgi:hypothetical protein